MRKTPEGVSRKLQDIRQKADIWRAGIAAARLDPTTEEARKSRIAFGEAEVAQLKKEILGINKKAKRAFWPREV